MNILVFDTNRVFAKKAASFLIEQLKNAEVDIADNAFILAKRLADITYDVIIADIDTAIDSKNIIKILRQYKTPVVIWSMLEHRLCENSPECRYNKSINKCNICPYASNVALEAVGAFENFLQSTNIVKKPGITEMLSPGGEVRCLHDLAAVSGHFARVKTDFRT